MITVAELRIRLYTLKSIPCVNASEKIGQFIDSGLGKDDVYAKFHKENFFKNYVFDGLYPLADKGNYLEDSIYTVRIRSVNMELLQYLEKTLPNHQTDTLKGIKGEIHIIPRKVLEKVYTLTPLILQNGGDGYWKGNLSFQEFEQRIKINLIKKYRLLMGEEIDEDFQLYSSIELKNKVPVKVNYKGISLLGDKVSITAAPNDMSQKILYAALGTGLGERNSRGSGFLNYRYL